VPRLVDVDLPAADLDPGEGAVLITGGTGGLGLLLARAVIAAGGHDIILVSRGGRNDAVAELEHELEHELEQGVDAGIRVRTFACDIADRGSVERLAADLRSEGTRVGTLVHAAGVVEFRQVCEIDADHLHAGMRAKVGGTDNVVELLGSPERVVLYSSIAAAWGSSGQGVYAAANAWLDGEAHRLRARGVRATSISWGPWAEVGMIRGVEDRMTEFGLRAMSAETTIGALAKVLRADLSHAVIAEVDWPTFLENLDFAGPQPLLTEVRNRRSGEPEPPVDAVDDSVDWTGMDPTEVARRITELVGADVAAVLGEADTRGVRPDVPFRDLGFDSLMAVDLRDRLRDATGLRIGAMTIFDHPTVEELAAEVTRLLTGADARSQDRRSDEGDGAAAERAGDPGASVDDLDEVSDADELLTLLEEEFGGIR